MNKPWGFTFRSKIFAAVTLTNIEEILSLSLKAELVVLSACNMGRE
ncbi:MAG: hypothetical protein HC835_15390 [Oscillatoriales cyanobacterium RM2_1_1]|nr:hypothetical protein [Oscillatoriales cyanobacterium SM2_3_0]NJO46888.1 hypothetical protein [Oscillatoriales cyanobacterium RM2_1_1]